MIYRFIRRIVKLSLPVYFKKIVFSGTEHIPETGPLIIAANHPNTFMDPMIMVAVLKQRIGFVANAGIFTNRFVSAIFRFFHVIPIFRKKDVAPGEKPDNKDSFHKCHEYLEGGGTFLIFPEGSSYYELNLREIKTGTARIALSFEMANDFKKDLMIIPVALNYSDSIQFRSVVVVTFHPPILVSEFKESYLRNESDGVKGLTERIREVLAESVPQTNGKEQEEFLINAHRFYSAYNEPEADLYLNPKRSMELRKQLSDAIQEIYASRDKEGLYSDIHGMISEYFEELKASNLSTGFFTHEFLRKNTFIVTFGYIMEFLLLLPFYLFGIITNYLPYILPSKIYEVSKLDIEYKTPLQMVSGLITFPLCYATEFWLFNRYVDSEFSSGLLFLIMLPITGYIAMYYWTELKRFFRVMRFYFLYPKSKRIKMLKLRNEILAKIKEAGKKLNVN